MTPRLIEIQTDAIQKIGKYVIVKNNKTNTFLIDMVDRVNAVHRKDSATFDLVTMNNYTQQDNAYARVYDSRREAEDALQNLNLKNELEQTQ